MKRTVFSLLCLLLSLLLLLPSCTTVSAVELSAGYQRRAGTRGEIAEGFFDGYVSFAFDLYRGFAPEGSRVLSPLSAMLCLGMIANGMGGETLRQTEETLGLELNALSGSLAAFLESVHSTHGAAFRYGNAVWLRDTAPKPKSSFLQTNADWYGAEVYAAPFDAGTEKDISAWAKRETDGMIDDLPIHLTGDELSVLISAIAFEAEWKEKYKTDQIRKNMEFTRADGTTETVTMLSSEEFRYTENDRFRGFLKEYEGGEFVFAAFLPKEGYTPEDMTAEDYTELWNGMKNAGVQVLMPEFRTESALDLTDLLKDLGMTDAFSPAADFSGMYESGTEAYLDYVKQNAMIDVSREGTKAAAVTWGGMKNGAAMPENEIVLDRPFTYAIVSSETGIPVFLGTWQGTK